MPSRRPCPGGFAWVFLFLFKLSRRRRALLSDVCRQTQTRPPFLRRVARRSRSSFCTRCPPSRPSAACARYAARLARGPAAPAHPSRIQPRRTPSARCFCSAEVAPGTRRRRLANSVALAVLTILSATLHRCFPRRPATGWATASTSTPSSTTRPSQVCRRACPRRLKSVAFPHARASPLTPARLPASLLTLTLPLPHQPRCLRGSCSTTAPQPSLDRPPRAGASGSTRTAVSRQSPSPSRERCAALSCRDPALVALVRSSCGAGALANIDRTAFCTQFHYRLSGIGGQSRIPGRGLDRYQTELGPPCGAGALAKLDQAGYRGSRPSRHYPPGDVHLIMLPSPPPSSSLIPTFSPHPGGARRWLFNR
jgi:hypothetical protein